MAQIYYSFLEMLLLWLRGTNTCMVFSLFAFLLEILRFIIHFLLIILFVTTRKMIYCNTCDPLLVSAGNSSRY
jgi:hypothetical protein